MNAVESSPRFLTRFPTLVCLGWVLASAACGPSVDPNVTTQHNNSFRTGAYLAETTLTPQQVKDRGMHVKYWVAPNDAFLASAPPGSPVAGVSLEGKIFTQLLYLRQVQFPKETANGLFAGTMRAKLYALNADNGNPEWARDLVEGDPEGCRVPRGLDATPVIDLDNHRIFVLFSTQYDENCGPSVFGNLIKYFLASLDLSTGDGIFKQVQARDETTGVPFTEQFQNAHVALLLDHKSVFIAFGSDAGLEGKGAFQGWIMRYNASDLRLENAFCTSPGEDPKEWGAGVWQGGGGLAANQSGEIFFLTGNGVTDFDRHITPEGIRSNHLYGDSFVRLALSKGKFVPSAFAPETGCGPLCAHDADLGSGGAMIIPDSNLVIGGGKTGVMYVLDQGTMAHVQEFDASTNQYHPWERWQNWDVGPHLHGSPTYWRGPDARFGNLYVWGEKDFLKLYRFDTRAQRFEMTPGSAKAGAEVGVFPFKQADIQALPTTMPGGMISVSANGNKGGTGIVWATLPVAPCMPSLDPCWKKERPPFPDAIYAFDAENLNLLWNNATFSMEGPHWAPPTIADGKVFVPSGAGMIVVYELCQEGMECIGSSTPIHPPIPSCQDCHSLPFQWSSLAFTPLKDRYPNEGAAGALPRMALRAIAPPKGRKQDLLLNGNGVQVFEAVETEEKHGSLKWQLKDSSAELWEFSKTDTIQKRSSGLLHIQITPGSKWSASDGSRATVRVERTAPAPEKIDGEWVLFKVVESAGQGVLSNHSFIQVVNTDGGAAPGKSPKRRGETARVPFRAQYWMFQ